MKEMEIKNRAQMQMALAEAEMLKEIMENISHPNVMHIEKVFQVGSKFYLVFPLCTGGELYEHVIRRGYFTERDAAVILKDLVSGLHALHQHDILHLDIKPENILFETAEPDAKIKITDFGLSRIRSESQSEQKPPPTVAELEERLKAFQDTGALSKEKLRGTVGYMSPELILAGYSCKATDVFAVGVVLFILLCGRPPFHSKSNREVIIIIILSIFSCII
jgi:calcium/calmodulin-dependent protein kinase I